MLTKAIRFEMGLTMVSILKQGVYGLARATGLFKLARWVTRNELRVLAYHAFTTGDEVEFRPKLFISASTFARRLETLSRLGVDVIPLDAAVKVLREGGTHPNGLAITIDDGFASTLSIAAPLLARHGFPSTVYLTTYHMEKQTPVFDLIVAYLLWKWKSPEIKLAWPRGADSRHWSLGDPAERQQALSDLLEIGHGMHSEAEREGLCKALAKATGCNYDEIKARQAFRLLHASEAMRLGGMGISIGLHTHRHRFPPDDLQTCRRELIDNADAIERAVGERPRHFCYPSGVYDRRQWTILSELGIASGATCDTGLVRKGDSPFGLRRFLDGEGVSDLEFEAEVCGFSELLRRWLRVDRRGGGF